MSDIVERIRSLRYVHVPVASQLFEEAANEIERLRSALAEYTDGISPIGKTKSTATDAANESMKIRRDAADLRGTPQAHATPSQCSDPFEGTEPVAWALICGGFVDSTFTDRDEAVEWASGIIPPPQIVPLYRRLTLTDAERRDIKVAADAYAYADHDPDCERIAATLRAGADEVMGITPEDIQAQRELLERGERILEAQEQQAERARLRDTFAAAALTGLLAQGDDGSFSEESYARGAYRWADAMLRERGRSYEQSDEKSRFHDMARATLNSGKYGPEWHAAVANLDAVPAARAVSDEARTDKAATSHRRDRSGNTPVAESATPERLRPDFERPK